MGTTASSPAAPHPEFRRGWKVLLSALLGIACGASPVPYSTTGVFLGPLHQQFGWSYAQLSAGLAIYGILGAVLAPYVGSLADRYGMRIVALASTLAFGLVFASFSLMPGSLYAFYGLWVLVGLCIGSTPVTWSRGVNLWFFRHRGLALGITLVGTALSAVVLPRLTLFYIEHFGWRLAFALLALLPLVVALPAAWLWFREPRIEERPPELSAAGGSARALAGVTLGEALRGYRFWVLIASIFIVSSAYGGAHVHLIEMLKLHGIPAAQAASVFAFLGFSILATRIGAGALLDRFWAPLVTLPLLAAPSIACWVLAGPHPLTVPVALLCAGLLGLASGAETDLVAYFASRYFGMAHYGRIYGVLYMSFGLGSAISPTIYGRVRDVTGSYQLALYGAGVAFLVGAVILLALGRYPVLPASPSRAAAGGGLGGTETAPPRRMLTGSAP